MRTNSANVKSTSVAPARAAVLSPVAVSCFMTSGSVSLHPTCIGISGAVAIGVMCDSNLFGGRRLQNVWLPLRGRSAAGFNAVAAPSIRPMGSWKRESKQVHN